MSSSPVSAWADLTEAPDGEPWKLSTLFEVSQALWSTLDLSAGVQRVLEVLGRHRGAIRSIAVVLLADSGDVEIEVSTGATPGQRVRHRVEEGIAGHVIAT